MRTPVHALISAMYKQHFESSASKQREKLYPMYVLNIECAHDLYDITFDPDKTLCEFKVRLNRAL